MVLMTIHMFMKAPNHHDSTTPKVFTRTKLAYTEKCLLRCLVEPNFGSFVFLNDASQIKSCDYRELLYTSITLGDSSSEDMLALYSSSSSECTDY